MKRVFWKMMASRQEEICLPALIYSVWSVKIRERRRLDEGLERPDDQ